MYNIEIDLKDQAIAIYPEIQNLSITPSEETQVFTHDGFYGYDIVTVAPGVAKPTVDNGVLIYTSGASVSEGVLEL